MKTAALGLWEGLSHSASLRSIIIVLKVVVAKTNWRGKNMEYEFKTTSLLPTKSMSLKTTSLISQPKTSLK